MINNKCLYGFVFVLSASLFAGTACTKELAKADAGGKITLESKNTDVAISGNKVTTLSSNNHAIDNDNDNNKVGDGIGKLLKKSSHADKVHLPLYLYAGYSPTIAARTYGSDVYDSMVDSASDIRRKLPKVLPFLYSEKYKSFSGGSIGVGKYLLSNTRVGVELSLNEKAECIGESCRLMGKIDGSTKSVFISKGFKLGSGSFNVFYDINHDSGLAPYVGVGIGVARIEFFSNPTESVASFAPLLQLKTGIKLNIPGSVPAYIGYKFTNVFTHKLPAIESHLPTTDAARDAYASRVELEVDHSGIGRDPTDEEKRALTESKPLNEQLRMSHRLHGLDIGVMFTY